MVCQLAPTAPVTFFSNERYNTNRCDNIPKKQKYSTSLRDRPHPKRPLHQASWHAGEQSCMNVDNASMLNECVLFDGSQYRITFQVSEDAIQARRASGSRQLNLMPADHGMAWASVGVAVSAMASISREHSRSARNGGKTFFLASSLRGCRSQVKKCKRSTSVE